MEPPRFVEVNGNSPSVNTEMVTSSPFHFRIELKWKGSSFLYFGKFQTSVDTRVGMSFSFFSGTFICSD